MPEITLKQRYKSSSNIMKELTEHSDWSVESIIEFLNSIEDADVVEVKHGEWVRHKENCLYNKCSICEKEHCCEDNYCPNCGAKMDGERKERS